MTETTKVKNGEVAQKLPPIKLRPREAGQELTAEKSLADILRKSWRLELTRRNAWFAIPPFVVLTAFVVFTRIPVPEIAALVRGWAEFGFNTTMTVLGFLIAGFTIFATLGKPDMFAAMAMIKDRKAGMSHLKVHFFAIMNVFMYYLAFVLLCLFVKMAAFPMGPISMAIGLLPMEWQEGTRSLLTRVGLVGVGTAFWFGVCFLSSFVRNVFVFVMGGVRWELHKMPDPGDTETPKS